ncbi:MAG: DJ-1/PfpI family protein [Deltaproteobacteria bacterium]|nr:DJ-1/PfpI family protein [Deltaproteobacteria bacterium]MBI3388878.1 DJ-1/PfpI family protein [Deltaproteobacteria bacterium]
MSLTTGILLFNDAEELDWAGPWEVFTAATMVNAGDRVVTIAETMAPIRCAKGLRVLPDHSFADAPALDVVLVPGGHGTLREVTNPVLLGWLRKTAARCTWVTSVCTGAQLLAEAGIAKGKRVTTHWSFIEVLRARGDVTVVERVRYVRDGNVVTSAGVSAGIDMALWLVGQIHGVDVARLIQKGIEYDPAPPYAADA